MFNFKSLFYEEKVSNIGTVCAVALGAYWNMNQNKEKSLLNSLALDNIDAIAACETGYGDSCWLNEYNLLDCCTYGIYGCAPCD